MVKPFLPIICGPTASGKTELALKLAEQFPVEIVSADSRQVYRMMDIGTAKPSRAEQNMVRHHLIDIVWPDENINAALFADLARNAIEDIGKRQCLPLLVGGTGLYIRALTEGLLHAPGADPVVRKRLSLWADQCGNEVLHQHLSAVDPITAARLHPNDRVRIIRALEVYEQTGRPLSELQERHRFADRPYRLLKVGLTCLREDLDRRIEVRAGKMFEAGLLDETEQLLKAGYGDNLKSLRTIGYRQAVQVLRGHSSYDEALLDLQRSTRRYARQQLTWLRQDNTIKWVDSSVDFDTIRKLIEDFYAN